MNQNKEVNKSFLYNDFADIFTMLKQGLESISLDLSKEDWDIYLELLSKFETPKDSKESKDSN
jgi:hypothetical protein